MSDMLTPTLDRTYRGHRNAVLCTAAHPSLQQVVSGSADACVMVWHSKSTLRAFRFVGHRGPVTGVAYNPQGNLIASCSSDTTLRLWIPTVRGESTMIKAHAAAVRCVGFSPDSRMIVTGSDDKSVKMWSTTTQRFAMSFPGHANWVRCAQVSPDGRLVASGGDDKVLHLWDVQSRKPTHSFFDHSDSVTAVAFHPDGHSVAAGSADRTINIWDLRTQKLLQHYDSAHTDAVSSLSFHSSGDWLLSSSMDGAAKLWDVKEGFLYCTVNAHEGGIHDAQFSPCGSQFVTGGRDSMVMVWNTNVDAGNSPAAADASTSAMNATNNSGVAHGGARDVNTNSALMRQRPTHRRVDPTNTVLSPPRKTPLTPRSMNAAQGSAQTGRPGSATRTSSAPRCASANGRAAAPAPAPAAVAPTNAALNVSHDNSIRVDDSRGNTARRSPARPATAGAHFTAVGATTAPVRPRTAGGAATGGSGSSVPAPISSRAAAAPAEDQPSSHGRGMMSQTMTAERHHAGVSAMVADPDVPMEHVMRQVDIAEQTQQILDARVTNSEAMQRTLTDQIRERDVRVSAQIDTLTSELQAQRELQAESSAEIRGLRGIVETQGSLLQQMMDQQHRLLAELRAARGESPVEAAAPIPME